MEHDFFKKYIDIINEAQAAPAGVKPTVPKTAGSTNNLSPEQQERLSNQTNPDVAGYYNNQEYGKTERTFGDNGKSEQVNKLTGIKTVSDPETGTKTYDAAGNLLKTDTGAFGFSKSVDARSGDTTDRFDSGDVSVSSTTAPGGYVKARDSSYQMGALNVAQSEKAPDYASGALAAPKTTTATYQKSADKGDVAQGTATTGVAFGGASGKNVGNNTITTGDQDLANAAQTALAPKQGQEPVSEEEEPESVRDLLKKLLDIVKDHEGPNKDSKKEDGKKKDEGKVDEDLTPTDPKEVGAKMNEPYITPTARAQDKPNPYADAPEPPKINVKTKLVPDAKFEEKVTEDENLYQREYQVAEEKIEESLRRLLKSIKEGK